MGQHVEVLTRDGRTLNPMCCSVRKNWAPKSSSVAMASSTMVREPMPASIRFFAISFPRALRPIKRTLALRSLKSS